MQHILEKKKQRQTSHVPAAQTVRRQLAWAAGSEFFENRDPLYHVTEDFQQTFDQIGRRHAAALTGESVGGFSGYEGKDGSSDVRLPDPTDARGLYQTRDPAQQDMVRRFSETAFQRGTLAGAVMAGTGKMMLVSCLKRTVGQSQPVKEQQRRLFEGGAQQRNIPGHSPDAVIFPRGFADSAVGLVVDTLQDVRQSVESMADLAAGKSDMGSGGGAQTLRRMYPFLDDSREAGLLDEYRRRLGESTDVDERALLQNACARTHALIDKKAQMRQEFINKLRQIADCATEALTLFETPGFAQQIEQEEAEPDDAPAPPDEPPEGREESHAADRTEP